MKPQSRIVQILLPDLRVLKQEVARSGANRFSVRAAADQRQLDALYSSHFKSGGGLIGRIVSCDMPETIFAQFVFDAEGNSQYVQVAA